MSAHVTKANQLLALAVSAEGIGSKEEARTAALMAALHIAKHKLLVIESIQTQEEEPYEPDPEEGLHRSRAVLKDLAIAKANRFVDFLEKKHYVSKGKDYPIFSARALTDQEVNQGRIYAVERSVFHYFLGLELSRLRVLGYLRSIPSKGFRLVEKKYRKKRKKAGEE